MAAAIVVPATAKVGEQITITGTGFANTTAFTTTITRQGQDTHYASGTTSGAGAITNAGRFVIAHEGIVTVSVSDGTSTVTDTIRVWRVA